MKSKLHYIQENLPLIEQMIREERPKFEIARILGIKYDTLNKNLQKLGITYNGNQNRKGIQHSESRKTLYDVFSGERYLSASKLRTRLIEDGFKEAVCECCGLTTWMDKPIPLELHHKNGNHYDNCLNNLEILCSNCHMQKHNYSNCRN